MDNTATITIGDKSYTYPIIIGTENERAIDLRQLRSDTGHITFDEGYGNTGSCESAITYIDGEAGILRNRGYAIEDLAQHSGFIETAYLIIYGELPNAEKLQAFRTRVRNNAAINTNMNSLFDGFSSEARPMAILSSLLNALGCYYPQMASNNREQDIEFFDDAAALLISKVRTIAAMAYRKQMGLPFVYPRSDLPYTSNFLHMMFSEPYKNFEDEHGVAAALDLFLMLHADHEQNCSTSTVRMVASSGANLFASVAAGVCALWGPLHGGANTAVVRMLEQIHRNGDDGSNFIQAAKDGKAKLMGFGHRVYKNYDPRAKIIGKVADTLTKKLGLNDPLLEIAHNLEVAALNDSYFIERKLYPNVDFYSGIILKAAGIPVDMFTVMFAIGRLPGWIANWYEIATNPKSKIHRPRQIYTGANLRPYIPLENRE